MGGNKSQSGSTHLSCPCDDAATSCCLSVVPVLQFALTLPLAVGVDETEGNEGGFENGSRAGASVCQVARLVDESIGRGT